MIDINKIKARLSSLNKGENKTSKIKDFIWKPKGKQIVRIIPYQHNSENPFIELKFHYNFAGKNYLSPSSFNRPDPIVELSEKLKKSGDTDQWRIGKKLEPKIRTYVPIIIRGEEANGMKFWGFGVSVYKQLMETMTEPEFGDITDLNNGYDIIVDFKDAKSIGKDYPETTILIKPKPRPAIEPTTPKAKEILETITKKQTNILDVFDLPSYDELSLALEEYLKKSEEGKDESSIVEPTEKQIEEGKSTVVAKKSNEIKTEKDEVKSATIQKSIADSDVIKTFDALFNEN